jgi:DNA-binding winged helix-turn-helix (wHTH) protein/tetratricopeptide (TPR) repeat protein
MQNGGVGSPIVLRSEPPFQVGHARVDPVSRDAVFSGTTERLQPQNLKVLIALARNKSRVVTRDELIKLCWESRFVGDDVIHRSISTLRQFGKRAGGFAIETVPRSGYRLIETTAGPRQVRRHLAKVTLLTTALIAVSLLIEHTLKSDSQPTLTVALMQPSTDTSDPATRKLAFDIRASLTHTLTQSRLKVQRLDSRQPLIGKLADLLMWVDVSRGPGKVIAAVRIEETVHHIIVYSQEFQTVPTGSASLPDQVGAQVAGSLSWTVPVLLLDRKHPSDPAILASIFKQRESDPSHRIADDDLLSIQQYETERSLAQTAPDSVAVQALLAFDAIYVLPQLPRAERAEALAAGRNAAARAHALAPEYADPFLAWCVLHSRARMIECEEHIRSGTRANPDAPFGDWFMADLLNQGGRFDDALHLAQRSLARDPFFGAKIALVLRLLEAIGAGADAEALYRKAKGWFPHSDDFVWSRIGGMIDRGDNDAIEHFEKQVGRDALPSDYQPLTPIVAAVRTRSVPALKSACSNPRTDSMKAVFCMLQFARLGENDMAFALAQRLYPQRVAPTEAEEDSLWLDQVSNNTEYLTGPAASAMRRDPRYFTVAQRVGLLVYWRSGRLPDFCRAPQSEAICSQLAGKI